MKRKLDDDRLVELTKIVTARLSELAEPDAWPVKALATVVPLDVDAYDAPVKRSEKDACCWDAGNHIRAGRRPLSVKRVTLADVFHERKLKPGEATGSAAGGSDPAPLLKELAEVARRQQVVDLFTCLVKHAEAAGVVALDAGTLKAKLNNLAPAQARTIVTLGPVDKDVEDVIKKKGLVAHGNAELAGFRLTIEMTTEARGLAARFFKALVGSSWKTTKKTTYEVKGALLHPTRKPVTVYRAADLGASVTASEDGGATAVVHERSAYYAVPDAPLVVFATRVG